MSKTSSPSGGGMTIGKRIGLGFGAVLALMVGVTSYGIHDVRQIDQALTEITEVNAVKQRHGINFRGSVHDRAISLRDVVLVNDRASLDQAFADITRLEQFYAESAQALDAMLAARNDTDAEETTILNSIKEIESTTMPLVRSVSEARVRGDRDTAHQIMMSQASPAFSEWLARINRYIDLQEARNQKATAVARGTASAFSFVMVALCALAIVLGIVIAWMISRSVLRSLGGEPADAARIVARIASGDLSAPVPSRNPDSMLGALGIMQDKLKDIFGQIVHSSVELASKAEKVGTASRDAVKAASMQAEASSASAESIAAMTESMRAVATAGHETQANSERTSQLSEQGTRIVENTATEIGRIAEIVRTSSARITDLQQRSQEIGGTAQVIKEIADQTNLLALNAAIEAARAGESGRGFAVVADEVRKLAERTSVATSEIAKVIEVIQADTKAAVSAMEEAGPQVERGLELARQATTTLADIHRQADSSLDNVRQVARTAQEQVSTAAQIASNVEKIAEMSSETNNAMNDNTRAAEDLQAISSLLRDHVARFKLA